MNKFQAGERVRLANCATKRSIKEELEGISKSVVITIYEAKKGIIKSVEESGGDYFYLVKFDESQVEEYLPERFLERLEEHP